MTNFDSGVRASGLSRRSLLRMGLGAAVLGPALAACTGADTSGGGGAAGSISFSPCRAVRRLINGRGRSVRAQ